MRDSLRSGFGKGFYDGWSGWSISVPFNREKPHKRFSLSHFIALFVIPSSFILFHFTHFAFYIYISMKNLWTVLMLPPPPERPPAPGNPHPAFNLDFASFSSDSVLVRRITTTNDVSLSQYIRWTWAFNSYFNPSRYRPTQLLSPL